MYKVEIRHKIKFPRKLKNKLNRSLAIIYNNSESSHDFHNININDNSIQNIANDNKTNAMLQKSYIMLY